MTDIRTNPVGTKEQREELRRHLKACDTLERDLNHLDDLEAALGGLDIAERYFNARAERVAHFDCHPCLLQGQPCPDAKAIEDRAEEALAEWKDWKGEPE